MVEEQSAADPTPEVAITAALPVFQPIVSMSGQQ
jgi:hypothetical protein